MNTLKPRKRALWTQAFPGQVQTKKTSPTRSQGPRKAIPARSKAMRKKMEEYRKLVDMLFGKDRNVKCGVLHCANKMEDCHHQRGRAGRLLTNPAWLIPVCRRHHEMCKQIPNFARTLMARNANGVVMPLLCAIGDWNKYEVTQ